MSLDENLVPEVERLGQQLSEARASIERRFVARNANIPWHADNSKAIRELGVTYRPMQETLEDMFAQMIEAGAFSTG